MYWHILDAGSVWLKEFASALGSFVPTQNWRPQMRSFGWLENWERQETVHDPALSITCFPLQRGYARFPIAQLFPFEKALVDRLVRFSKPAERSVLICTSPFYAPVAERWPGQVVYYLTDLTKKYAGMDAVQVVKMDRRMCRVAQTVCPNSRRIADYLRTEAGCDLSKITVIPNATRRQNVLSQPITRPQDLPADIADLPRPVVGVIGNFAENMDWTLLTEAVNRTKSVSWAFVGPTDMPMADRQGREARRELMKRAGRVRFLGSRPYGELCQYARSFDVALIPYQKLEPTISGSATRFYEHLAACRPILASRAHLELLTKEPLLKLVDTGDDVALEIERLRTTDFRDGFEELRWKASHEGTWLTRARALVSAAGQLEAAKIA